MAGSLSGIYKIAVNTASLTDGASIASYLTDAAGNLLTSTAIGGKQRLDGIDAASHVDGAAYAAGVDYLSSMGAVDESGNWQPLNINAAGALIVSASVSFPSDYAEDSAAASGDIGSFSLLVRQDTLAASTSTDGDYGAFKSNALGELYVHDTSALAELVLIKGDTASIVTSSGTTASNTTAIAASTASIDTKSTTIASNTGTTATNTGTIASTLTALSKSEDVAHSSGDQGMQALAVRKDAQGTNVSTDGDYSSLLTWSEGSLKVIDIANGAALQQRISVATTATALPTAALANRKSLMIQNAGSASVWVGSATVTASGATTGIEVPKGGFMEFEVGPAVTMYAIAASGTVTANVFEMS